MRRTTGMLAVAALAAMALAGCSGAVPDGGSASGGTGTGGGSGVQTVEIYSNFTSDIARGKVLDQLIAEFNEAHAGQYQAKSVTEADWPTLQQKIRSKISAGSTPDVFLYNFNPTDLSREQSGQLMDWTSALGDDPEWKARFSADDLAELTVDGQVVGIPGDQAPTVFYYNTALLEAAGIDTIPTTWDEFMTAAQALKDSGVAAISLMTADDAWHTMNVYSYLATAAGGLDAYADGSSFDLDALTKAAEDTKELFGYSTADAVGANYSVSTTNFLTGQSAVIVDGPWFISSVQGQMENPDDVVAAAAPTFGDGVAPAGYTVTDSLNVWAAAKQSDPQKQAAVVEWMKFFTSNDSAVRMAVDGEYPLAVQTQLGDADAQRASSQMQQVLDIANAAPAKVVQMGRGITTSAQEQLPSLLESLALGRQDPAAFAAALQAANK